MGDKRFLLLPCLHLLFSPSHLSPLNPSFPIFFSYYYYCITLLFSDLIIVCVTYPSVFPTNIVLLLCPSYSTFLFLHAFTHFCLPLPLPLLLGSFLLFDLPHTHKFVPLKGKTFCTRALCPHLPYFLSIISWNSGFGNAICSTLAWHGMAFSYSATYLMTGREQTQAGSKW